MAGAIIYPGTFDPITKGHIDLIERASKLFSKVVIAIASNPKKQPLFTLKERMQLVRKSLIKYHNVEICSFDGLLINLSRAKKINMVLRGLRAISDFEYELQLASINRMMYPKIETVFLTPSEKYAYVSASMAREVASLGGDASFLVPRVVCLALERKFRRRHS